jgi:hypothetical protein
MIYGDICRKRSAFDSLLYVDDARFCRKNRINPGRALAAVFRHLVQSYSFYHKPNRLDSAATHQVRDRYETGKQPNVHNIGFGKLEHQTFVLGLEPLDSVIFGNSLEASDFRRLVPALRNSAPRAL